MQLLPQTRWSPVHAVLTGGLVVGVLDGLDAIILFALRGVSPVRLFQGIASRLIGPAARDGGVATALLGVAMHFMIALTMVLVYYLASRRFAVLTRRAVLCGISYGVGAYFFMVYVVLPNTVGGQFHWSIPPLNLVNGVLIHAFGVGLPSALFARMAAPAGVSDRDHPSAQPA